MNTPAESSPEEIWGDGMSRMRKIESKLYAVAEALIIKGRIRYGEKEPTMDIWMFSILPEIFETRLNTTREILLGQYGAFHALLGSTTNYNSKKTFDLPNGGIENCANQLLAELTAENTSTNTYVLEL